MGALLHRRGNRSFDRSLDPPADILQNLHRSIEVKLHKLSARTCLIALVPEQLLLPADEEIGGAE
jgi:hypothetical protein